MKNCVRLLIILTCVLIFTACNSKAVETDTTSSIDTPDQVQEKLPEKELPQSAQKLLAAKANNPDTTAWLVIPGTNIDDPVMQSTDNDYYLKRDENGDYDQWGCYFADYYSILTDRESLQQNTVIYGHAQNDDHPDGKKFSQLFHYLDMDFLKENHDITLTVEQEELTFEVCAVFITDIEFYYINPTPSDEGFSEFASTVAAKNEYIFGSGNLVEQDKLLTLSACSHQYDVNNTRNQRIVVMARLVEDTAQRTAFSVQTNPNPQRP